jgi:hypothetical protein
MAQLFVLLDLINLQPMPWTLVKGWGCANNQVAMFCRLRIALMSEWEVSVRSLRSLNCNSPCRKMAALPNFDLFLWGGQFKKRLKTWEVLSVWFLLERAMFFIDYFLRRHLSRVISHYYVPAFNFANLMNKNLLWMGLCGLCRCIHQKWRLLRPKLWKTCILNVESKYCFQRMVIAFIWLINLLGSCEILWEKGDNNCMFCQLRWKTCTRRLLKHYC